jgi:hypothetical protein
MNKELISYITDAKTHGLTEQEIKQNLLDAGWEAAAVEESFTHVKLDETKTEAAVKTKLPFVSQPKIEPVASTAEKDTVHVDMAEIVGGSPIPGQLSDPAANFAVTTPWYKRTAFIAIPLVVIALGIGGYFAYAKYGLTPITNIWKKASKTAENINITIKPGTVYQNDFKITYHDPLEISDKSRNDFGASFLEKLKDFTVSFEGKFYIDLSDSNNPQSTSNVKYTFGSGNTSFTTGLEYKLINRNIYVNTGDNVFLSTIINEMVNPPSYNRCTSETTLRSPSDNGMIAPPPCNSDTDTPKKIQWIKINLDDIQNQLSSQDKQDYETYKEFFNPSLKNDLNKLWEDAKLVKVESTLGVETLNGVSTIHYKNTLEKAAVKRLFSDYIDRLAKVAGDSVNQADINTSKMVVNALVDRLEVKQFETWVGEKDYNLYQVKLVSNAPSLVSVINGFSESNSGTVDYNSDEYKKISDIQTYKYRLADYKSHNGGYPAAKDGDPDGIPNYSYYGTNSDQTQNFHITPPATSGNCTDYYNPYWYEPQGAAFQKDGKTLYPSFQITFCLGKDTSDYSTTYQAGVGRLTPDGIEDNIACPTTASQCYKDPSKDNGDHDIAARKQKKIKDMIAKIDFSAQFTIDANYHDYDKKQKLDAPQDPFDLIKVIQKAQADAADAKRLADVRQLSSALELYYNDKNEYPTNLKDATPIYIGLIPTPPAIAEGGVCSAGDNTYSYTKISNEKYTLTFCLGHDTGGYQAGKHTLSPLGIQ